MNIITIWIALQVVAIAISIWDVRDAMRGVRSAKEAGDRALVAIGQRELAVAHIMGATATLAAMAGLSIFWNAVSLAGWGFAFRFELRFDPWWPWAVLIAFQGSAASALISRKTRGHVLRIRREAERGVKP